MVGIEMLGIGELQCGGATRGDVQSVHVAVVVGNITVIV